MRPSFTLLDEPLIERILAAGGAHNCVVIEGDNGNVACWGANWGGQLGDGTTTESQTPVQVKNFAGATAIKGGEFHTVALKNDGTIWAWGDNTYGELGNGSTSSSSVPVNVTGLSSGVAAISSGVGFAVPAHIFVNVYNQILDKGKVERGYLGVNMNLLPFTPAMAKYFGVKQGSGVLVTGLAAPDASASDTAGPAAKAGIKPEDVIVEFGGKPIYDVPDLRLAAANTPQPGTAPEKQ